MAAKASTSNHLTEAAESLAARAGEAGQEFRSVAADLSSRAAVTAEEVWAGTTDAAEEAAEVARARAGELFQKVRANPKPYAIGAAVVVAVLLLARRKRS